MTQGDYAAAKPLYEQALAIRERALGREHPVTARTLNGLAMLLQVQGDYAAAKPLYERALAIFERALGQEHPDTAKTLNNLAVLHWAQGDVDGAEILLKKALEIARSNLETGRRRPVRATATGHDPGPSLRTRSRPVPGPAGEAHR